MSALNPIKRLQTLSGVPNQRFFLNRLPGGGYWSRRITSEHRIVYKKTGDQILIAQLRYHYR